MFEEVQNIEELKEKVIAKLLEYPDTEAVTSMRISSAVNPGSRGHILAIALFIQPTKSSMGIEISYSTTIPDTLIFTNRIDMERYKYQIENEITKELILRKSKMEKPKPSYESGIYIRKYKVTQWNKMGDHPSVRPLLESDDIEIIGMAGILVIPEGRDKCGYLEGNIVRPGDYIVYDAVTERLFQIVPKSYFESFYKKEN